MANFHGKIKMDKQNNHQSRKPKVLKMYRAKTQFSVPCLISAMQCYYVRSTVSKDIKVVVPTYEITTLEESKSMRTKLTDSEKPIRTRVYD